MGQNDTLLPELEKLRGTGAAGDARDTVASIFKETRNRMLSGYLLGDLIDQIVRAFSIHRIATQFSKEPAKRWIEQFFFSEVIRWKFHDTANS